MTFFSIEEAGELTISVDRGVSRTIRRIDLRKTNCANNNPERCLRSGLLFLTDTKLKILKENTK